MATSTPLSSTLLADTQTAWSAYVFKTMKASLAFPPNAEDYDTAKQAWDEILSSEKDVNWVETQKVKEEKFGMYLSAVRAGLAGLVEAERAGKEGKTGAEEAQALITSNHDSLSLWLDKKVSGFLLGRRLEKLTSSELQLGSTVNDPTIFRDLAAYWEDSFFKSMSALHVERPTTLTRVSEYLPEIVKFVEGIVDRGLAYEAGGSVWFDTTKFEGAKGGESKEGQDEWQHTYAKLQPWSKGNRELLEDGEGEYTLLYHC